jgi:2-polyprenyl-3-methyl-5-hydroxy-6-metoxy-1,4-benzoquinol methylase
LSSIYEVPVDPNAENNSHAFALSLVGYNKAVLEVGCSTGYLTKVMVERGCNVVGIELDPEAAEKAEEWAERVVVGNIDEGDVWNYVKDEAFDVAVLGDVLEHLRDPLASLRQAVRKLKATGYVVTSLPNVAHGDVRIALLQGRFRYAETGLLDRTHMRFFTLETIRDLLKDAGLVVVDTKRVVMPLFHSELGVKRGDVSHKTLDELHADPEVETYQFVMKSIRDNGDLAVAQLANKVSDLTDRVHNQRMRIALMRKGLRDNHALDMHLREHQRYVKALEGHVSGLEHNIEVLNEALVASETRYQALLGQKSAQVSSPLRRAYHALARTFKKPN